VRQFASGLVLRCPAWPRMRQARSTEKNRKWSKSQWAAFSRRALVKSRIGDGGHGRSPCRFARAQKIIRNRPVALHRARLPGRAAASTSWARIVGDYISRNARAKQVYVEKQDRPRGGTIGIDTAIKSAPDGYSLLLTNDNVGKRPRM